MRRRLLGNCVSVMRNIQSSHMHIYMNKSLPCWEMSRMSREERGSGGRLTLFKWLVLAASFGGITPQLHLPSGVLGSPRGTKMEIEARFNEGS